MLSRHALINITSQTLTLFCNQLVVAEYLVSTALNGPGELKNSGCTPRGKHRVRAKIGSDAPEGSVFVGRRPTGEIYCPELAAKFPERDWILSRILWLSGMEVGKNRLGSVDTMQRYIYIHGTPQSEPMGKPLSHGCIRMRNTDVIGLYNQLAVGDIVDIVE